VEVKTPAKSRTAFIELKTARSSSDRHSSCYARARAAARTRPGLAARSSLISGLWASIVGGAQAVWEIIAAGAGALWEGLLSLW
jgi:hypothetical protein